MQLADTHVENPSNDSKFDKKKLAEYQDHIDFCKVHLELELSQCKGVERKMLLRVGKHRVKNYKN